MPKANYAAWEINAQEFSHDWSNIQKIAFFARYAILAPSGHNTQPWRFVSDAQNQTLHLMANFGRRLPYSGLQANEPYVSLGTCLSIMQLAAKGFGYDILVEFDLHDDHIASVKLGSRVEAEPALLDAIVHRVSNRQPYDQQPLPADTLASITTTDLPGLSTHVVSNREDIAYVAQLTDEATRRFMSEKGFRLELSKWVRNNLTRQYDGMPGFVQGIPTPVSLLAKHVIKNIDVSKDQAKKDSGRVLQSANLIIVAVDNADSLSIINAGRLYAQICVRAQQQGLATTGIGAAIIDSASAAKITEKYHINGKPLAIIRIGKTTKAARHTPRWPLSQILSEA